jgi:small subunit ribosomal protein S5
MKNQIDHNQPKEFDEKIVQVNRVSKKTKGGNKIGFSVLVVVGDKKGKVGVGLGGYVICSRKQKLQLLL